MIHQKINLIDHQVNQKAQTLLKYLKIIQIQRNIIEAKSHHHEQRNQKIQWGEAIEAIEKDIQMFNNMARDT